MCLGVGVATETEEAGLVCHHGTVMIVDAENGQHEIHRRVRSLGLPAEGVSVYEAEGFDLRRSLDQLEAALEAERPDLLILDSFRSIWSGEENDSGAVAAVLDPLRNLIRRYDAGTLLLHHSGKGNVIYRGSSAIGASAELGFRLARVDEDPERDRRYLQCWKCRPAPEPPRRWLRLSAELDLVLIDEAEPFEAEEPERPALTTAKLAPKLLEALKAGPLTVSDLARAVGRKPGNGSVTRAMDALCRSEDVERDEDRRYRLSSFPTFQTPKDSGKVESGKPPSQPKSGPGIVGGTVATQGTVEGATMATDADETELERIRAKFADDGLDDLGPEQPLPDPAAEAFKPKPCRCDHPLVDRNEDGDLVCVCGRAAR